MTHAGDFELICPTIRPELAEGLVSSVAPVGVKIVDGTGASSFAALCNSVVQQSDCKFVLIANDKSRPTVQDVHKILDLLKAGYGLVGLYRLGFFGISKEVIRYIGSFDEGFSDGGFEDNDLYLRFKRNDIGIFLSEEIQYLAGRPSSWRQVRSRRHFFEKYDFGIFSKAIFANLADLGVANELSRPVGLKVWHDSKFGVVPLETKKSKFEVFLRDGWFVEKTYRRKPKILFNRFFRGIANVMTFNIPPILEWRRYKFRLPKAAPEKTQ